MDQIGPARFTREFNYYRLVRVDSAYSEDSTDFFGGIDLLSATDAMPLIGLRRSLNGIGMQISVDSLLGVISPAMQTISDLLSRLPDPRTLRILTNWREDLEEIVLSACEIGINARPGDSIIVAGQQTHIVGMISRLCSAGLERGDTTV
jgi:hypothetical protein